MYLYRDQIDIKSDKYPSPKLPKYSGVKLIIPSYGKGFVPW